MNLTKKIATKYYRSDGCKKGRSLSRRAVRRTSKRTARAIELRIALSDGE